MIPVYNFLPPALKVHRGGIYFLDLLSARNSILLTFKSAIFLKFWWSYSKQTW